MEAAVSRDPVLCDDGAPVCTVTINRPDVLNALDETVLVALRETFERLAAARDVRCVILTGAGNRAFVAGADVAHMTELTVEQARRFAAAGHAMAGAMSRLPAAIVAAVGGYALGGGLELALSADFIYASRAAKLGLPEVTLGVIPGFGGIRRLADRIGLARAREMVMTGRIIDAEEAARIGLVNRVTEPDALLPSVREVADTIARSAPLAVAAARRAFGRVRDLPLDMALALEQELFASLFATADQKEGMRAFVAKRKAVFQGR